MATFNTNNFVDFDFINPFEDGLLNTMLNNEDVHSNNEFDTFGELQPEAAHPSDTPSPDFCPGFVDNPSPYGQSHLFFEPESGYKSSTTTPDPSTTTPNTQVSPPTTSSTADALLGPKAEHELPSMNQDAPAFVVAPIVHPSTVMTDPPLPTPTPAPVAPELNATLPPQTPAAIPRPPRPSKKPAPPSTRKRGRIIASTDAKAEEKPAAEATRDKRKATQAADSEPDTKRRHFLERNRLAASKCRERKKQSIRELAEKSKILEETHVSLLKEMEMLKSERAALKHQVMTHAGCTDQNIDKWVQNQASDFVNGAGCDEGFGNGGRTMSRRNTEPSGSRRRPSTSSDLLDADEVPGLGFAGRSRRETDPGLDGCGGMNSNYLVGGGVGVGVGPGDEFGNVNRRMSHGSPDISPGARVVGRDVAVFSSPVMESAIGFQGGAPAFNAF